MTTGEHQITPENTKEVSGKGFPEAVTKEEPILTWSVHLAQESSKRMVIALLSIISTAIAGYAIMGRFGYIAGMLGGAVGAFAIFSSLSDYLFPLRYEITRDHATCKRLMGITQIEWKNVKRCYLDDLGVKLSPLVRNSKLEAYRGVFLRFGPDNKEQIIETVKSLRPQ